MSIETFRRFFRHPAGLLMGLIAFACRPDIPPHPYLDSEFLRQEVDAGRAFLIDSRSEEEFPQGHIPGAINIPHTKMKENISRVPKGMDIILYCGMGVRSQKALEILRADGYERLFNFGGMDRYEGRLAIPGDPE